MDGKKRIFRDTIQDAVLSMASHDPDRTDVLASLGTLNELIASLRQLAREWDSYSDHFDLASFFPYQVPLWMINGQCGCPCFELKEQVEHLRSLNFTWIEIASILEVSTMTIY